jgi:hypothetical protein
MTINWSPTPPNDNDYCAIRLVRTPVGRAVTTVICSHTLIGCPTHYAGGRTQPCSGADCELCAKAFSARWHGYLHTCNPESASQNVLELTGAAAQQLLAQAPANGDLRGYNLTCGRTQKRANARVLITLAQQTVPDKFLPPPLDVQAYLQHVWAIDQERGIPAAEQPARKPYSLTPGQIERATEIRRSLNSQPKDPSPCTPTQATNPTNSPSPLDPQPISELLPDAIPPTTRQQRGRNGAPTSARHSDA